MRSLCRNVARVPDNVLVDVKAVVDRGLNVRFHVLNLLVTPAGTGLQALLDKTYSPKMSNALKSAKLIDNPVTINIATFSA